MARPSQWEPRPSTTRSRRRRTTRRLVERARDLGPAEDARGRAGAGRAAAWTRQRVAPPGAPAGRGFRRPRPRAGVREEHPTASGRAFGSPRRRNVTFTLNGKPVRLEADPGRPLLWVLRIDLGLTGTKYGCGAGLCGSCTVVVDGKAVRSCQTSLAEVEAKAGHHHRGPGPGRPASTRSSRRSSDKGGFQCGFCTPGMIMNAYGLLLADPRPSREQVIEGDGGQPLPLQRVQADPGGDRVGLARGDGRPAMSAATGRRTFLKRLGGIVVLVRFAPRTLLAQGRGYPTDVNAYLHIGEDGRVTVFSGKIEMGQGVMTSLAQMAAEDLGVPLDAIEMVMGDTDRCPWDMGTFGSLTTRMFGPALRAAAAEARQILLQLAAEKLGAPRTASSSRTASSR